MSFDNSPKGTHSVVAMAYQRFYIVDSYMYEGWNFNSGNYLFTTDTK